MRESRKNLLFNWLFALSGFDLPIRLPPDFFLVSCFALKEIKVSDDVTLNEKGTALVFTLNYKYNCPDGVYDEDIALMRTIVDATKEAGISAVIAADVAVMAYCCEVGQEVHLSTQLNISNAMGIVSSLPLHFTFKVLRSWVFTIFPSFS